MGPTLKVSPRAAVNVSMENKKPTIFHPGDPLHAEAVAYGQSLAAIRKAQRKTESFSHSIAGIRGG